MTLFRTVEPAAEPVGVEDVKAQLRIAQDSEDGFLAALIKAAREVVEAETGLALIAQSWRLTRDRWPWSGFVSLSRTPVTTVTSVTAYGSEGEASLIDPATYQADLSSRPARLYFADRPEPLRVMNGIEIDFTAGFGATADAVPERLKRAVLLLVAHWYEFRAAFGAADQPVSIPAGVGRLLAGYRAMRL